MELRNYQEECLEEMKHHKKQLIQLPTGSGKTIIFLKYLRENSKKALIVCPTLDLQEQIYISALNFFHKDEISHNTLKRSNGIEKIFIVVAPSLNNEENRSILLDLKLDHIIIDEAHRAMSATYQKFLDFYSEFGTPFKLIGFTATPERLDRKPLLKLFEKITYQKTLYDMIHQGYLCDIESYKIKTKEIIHSKGRNEDFSQIELKNLDNYSRNSLIYKTYFENCLDKKTLIFCISIDHAEKIAKYLREEKGIAAHHIHGRQSFTQRQMLLSKFKSGEIKVLTNCQLLTEGFDEPSIESIIIARPTRSKSLYCQMIGRGTRKFPGKNICTLFELTDNTHRICTFNLAADDTKDENFIRDYRDGIKLSELKNEIEEISLSDFIIEKEKIILIDDFSSYLASHGILEIQKKKLSEKNIPYMYPTNLLQASFLLFKQSLREKYGYN